MKNNHNTKVSCKKLRRSFENFLISNNILSTMKEEPDKLNDNGVMYMYVCYQLSETLD